MKLCSQSNINHATAHQIPLKIGQRNIMLVRFVDSHQHPFSWSAIAMGLSNQADFRQLWNQTWADIPFDFLWQPVPIHSGFSTTYPFFTVLIPSSFGSANPDAYQQYLQKLKPHEQVATFPNLSGDALLVVPKATGKYGHLAAFCRLAGVDLQHALWKKVGEIAKTAIEKGDSIWCNTHGHGVPWTHVRFDSCLKYFTLLSAKSINNKTQIMWYENFYSVYTSSSQL
ncbi:DUF6940 family protein [Planktothrix mougeotii]|uniref:Uncharacterized protein n=1 Tax=Planktothrix mougeotii LEGE 06226 TaxID=1828728 RepID=A0ABR9UC64_9CYAN|nr:hypothetical protein [Planktothrix mougeotii]MBE9144060.1 hypothetical protein [Planktothrix mougeotii LEGE 06226]